ncbi:MAG TPA: hypothetical protein VH593_30590, partial [Ktedonobacteraceae bacterium]
TSTKLFGIIPDCRGFWAGRIRRLSLNIDHPELLISLGGGSQGGIPGVGVIIQSARFNRFILIQGTRINQMNLGALNDDPYTA